MRETFLRNFSKFKEFNPELRFLLACSGGIDSMVLLDLMKEAKCDFAVAHCNFQLRGEASDLDEAFVKRICEQLSVPFFSIHFNTTEYAQEFHISTQMAARELRYEWFAKIQAEQNYPILVTAHHANDNFETAVFNLTKGSGIAGLRGMKVFDRNIYRPLLGFAKKEIVDFAKANEIAWREDESNASTKYARNNIRHRVLPALEAINPSLQKTFQATSLRLQNIESLIEQSISHFEENYRRGDAYTFKLNDAKNEAAFIEILHRKGFNIETINAFVKGKVQTGAVKRTHDWSLWKDRDELVLKKAELTSSKAEGIELGESIEKLHFMGWELGFNWDQSFDLNTVLNSPNSLYIPSRFLDKKITLRPFQKGDRMQPFGLKGSKLLSDILIDQKVPNYAKNKHWVLECSEGILAFSTLKKSELLRFTGVQEGGVQIIIH